jgi:hypothetical protein
MIECETCLVLATCQLRIIFDEKSIDAPLNVVMMWKDGNCKYLTELLDNYKRHRDPNYLDAKIFWMKKKGLYYNDCQS